MSRSAAIACLLAVVGCGARTSLDGSSPSGAGAGGAGGAGSGGSTTAIAGSVSMGGAPATGFCGDALQGPGEQCDLGPLNDDGPALLLHQGAFSQPVFPLVGPGTVQDFYAYSSESSHTGYEELGESKLMLYRSTFDSWLSLVMHHGIDFDSTGIRQAMSSVVFRITISGEATFSAFVALSDEPVEVQPVSEGEIAADWTFNGNSDGGVIAGLPFPGEWSIVVTPSFISNIQSWDWVDATVTIVPLDTAAAVQIDSRLFPSSCRLDCTVPRCGDGRLDGGEICDDGNLLDGDGCPSTCLAN